MAGVFLSYRRADSAGWAGRLGDHLATRFGNDLHAWQDVEEILPGANWLDEIKGGLAAADAVLVIIGPRWLELGGARLKDPADVLHQEILLALNSKAVVIPVLVGGAQLPDRAALPEPLQPLTARQAMAMLDTDWDRSVQRLVQGLRETVEKSRPRVPHNELVDRLYAMQSEFFAALDANTPQPAEDVVRRALALLDRELPQYPQDAYLQLFRGYFEKNLGIVLRERGDESGAAAAVERADRVFRVMKAELEAQTASVYNGIGSALLMKDQPREALEWIDRALKIAPDYPEALHDRELALSLVTPSRRRLPTEPSTSPAARRYRTAPDRSPRRRGRRRSR